MHCIAGIRVAHPAPIEAPDPVSSGLTVRRIGSSMLPRAGLALSVLVSVPRYSPVIPRGPRHRAAKPEPDRLPRRRKDERVQIGNGAQGRNRTTDTAIFSRMLYQLSYLGRSPNWPDVSSGGNQSACL